MTWMIAEELAALVAAKTADELIADIERSKDELTRLGIDPTAQSGAVAKLIDGLRGGGDVQG